jgi:hypothetical protein
MYWFIIYFLKTVWENTFIFQYTPRNNLFISRNLF